MAELTTTKALNISQLCVEIGRKALRVLGPDDDGTYVVKFDEADLSEADMQVALDAHVADPNWTDPNPPPLSAEDQGAKDTATQLEQIRTKAKAVFAGTDTFTTAQVQKILAGLVLRQTR